MTYLDISADTLGSTSNNGECSRGAVLASRGQQNNPDHHLWNNRGTWWCHFTLHKADYTSERIRVSLKTHELLVARQRRDELLASLA